MPSRPIGGNTLKKLQAIDLALIEVGLYLDSYPDNREALAYYSKLAEEHERLSTVLAKEGKPTTQIAAGRPDTWDWISSPWPWDIEANT